MTTKLEAIKARLNIVLSVKAEDYKLDDFANNPDGYMVSPYCNEETTSTAFEVGFNSAVAELLPLLEQAVQLIDKNVSECPYSCLEGDCSTEWDMEVKVCPACLDARQFLASLEAWGKK